MPLYLTNIAQMGAVRAFSRISSDLNTVFQRLASGKRINSAKDDPAGLMIANRLTAQINGYNQGSRNLNDGLALAQTMEGALDESVNMLQRIRTLAVQASSGTYSDDDRVAIDLEVSELCKEINRISKATTYAGSPILDGNSGLFSTGSVSIQCSGAPNDTISIPGASAGFSMLGLCSQSGLNQNASYFKNVGGEFTFSVTSAQNAEDVISSVDKYLNSVDSYRGRLGAVQTRFESAIRLNGVMAENLSDARSRIQDTDYAEEAANLAKLMTRQNILASIFPQINSQKNIILSLLSF